MLTFLKYIDTTELILYQFEIDFALYFLVEINGSGIGSHFFDFLR